MYKLIFEKHAFKDLDEIPNKDLSHIQKIFEGLKHNPRPPASKKLIGKPARYRVRKGHYRVVYIVEDKTKTVKIMLVRHRKDVYR